MKSVLRLFFDECCSLRLARELSDQRSAPPVRVVLRHLLDHYRPGTPDARWLETLRTERDWIVVTQDMGRNPQRDKLPMLCREWDITHLAFTAALIDAGFETQKAALLAIWPHLFDLARLPRGTQVKLGFGTRRGGVRTFELRVGGKPLARALAAADAEQARSDQAGS